MVYLYCIVNQTKQAMTTKVTIKKASVVEYFNGAFYQTLKQVTSKNLLCRKVKEEFGYVYFIAKLNGSSHMLRTCNSNIVK